MFNANIRGWINYYGCYYKWALYLSHCLKLNVTERRSLPHLKCYPRRPCGHDVPNTGGIMTLKMTHAMRMELADAIRDRYAATANKDKSGILEEFIAATGYHEKSAIRVLNAS